MCAVSGSNTSYTVGNATTKFFCLKCFSHGVTFAMSSHLVCLQFQLVFMIIFTMLICLYPVVYIYSVLSSTTFTYSYVFIVESFELSECDRTLTSICFLSQILSLQIICILLKLSNVFSTSLSAEDTVTIIKSIFQCSFLHLKPGEVGTATRQSRHALERGTTSDMLHDGHVSFRCESPGAPV